VADDQSQPTHANGFLFADLRGYTRYVETHGDHAAAELLATYRELVRTEVGRSKGAEIRTEGDSFYVVFPSASGAIRTALAILDAAHVASSERPDRPIRVGIGIHAGETAETSEGLVGSAVNIAARVCAQAKAGELLVTDIVRGLTRTSLPFAFAPVGRRRLKGVAEPVALYRVEAMTPGASPARRLGARSLVALAIPLLLAVGIAGAAALGLLGGRAEATFPTTAEKDLLSRLPVTVHQEGQTNCARSAAADAAPGASASVDCQLPPDGDASEVMYDQFASSLQMGTFVDAIQNRRHLPEGMCATAPAAWQVWLVPVIGQGKLLCYPDESGHAWVVWTYSSSVTLGRATRGDDDWHALYSWWSLNAPLILR
jgi:class 3 adenylate cyclase